MMFVMLLAAAAQAPSDKVDCRETATTQYELTECARQHYIQSDRALNSQWQATSSKARKYDQRTYPRFLNAQRAWLRYRDETCGWVRGTFGGTIAPMNFFNCMETVTRRRTDELKHLAANPNSDEAI